jgi:hypothetical protein
MPEVEPVMTATRASGARTVIVVAALVQVRWPAGPVKAWSTASAKEAMEVNSRL